MTSTPNKRASAGAAVVNANVQSPGKGDAPRFLSLLQEMQNRDVDGGRPGVGARLTPSGKGKERAVEEAGDDLEVTFGLDGYTISHVAGEESCSDMDISHDDC